MRAVLMTWAAANTDVGYKQGMHELVAPRPRPSRLPPGRVVGVDGQRGAYDTQDWELKDGWPGKGWGGDGWFQPNSPSPVGGGECVWVPPTPGGLPSYLL